MAFTTLIAKDSSGNGNDGQYNTDLGKTEFARGVVPGDLAWNAGTAHGSAVQVPVAPVDWKHDFSIECWIKGPTSESAWNVTATGSNALFMAQCDPLITPIEFALVTVNGGTTGAVMRIRGNTGGSSYGVGDWYTGEVVPYDGAAHHLVITYAYTALPHGNGLAAGVVTFYLDAGGQTLVGNGTTGGPAATAPPDLTQFGLGWEGASTGSGPVYYVGAQHNGMLIDEFALYDHVLSSGRVSAHFSAAASGFAAYTAVVLADSPTDYYHLDDQPALGWYINQIAMTSSS